MGKRVHYAGALAATTALLLGSVAGCPFHAETFVQHCAADTDCDDGIECTTDQCTNTVCSNTNDAAHTPCSNGGVCDGKVTCLGCIDDTDCMMFHSTSPVCDPKTQACVSCHDGIKNGNEQGVDCGGPDCGACPANPCDPKNGCGDNTVCAMQESVCCDSACTAKCQACTMKDGAMADGTCGIVKLGEDPFGQCNMKGTGNAGGCGATMASCACADGQKNLNETDVDCGGGDCPGCEGGMTCAQDADCALDVANCVKGICCNATCTLPCTYCDSTGMCTIAPSGYSDPFCAAPTVCSPNGCVSTAGAPCTGNSQCLSNSCVGSKCATSPMLGHCSTNADCMMGTNCQNYVCM